MSEFIRETQTVIETVRESASGSVHESQTVIEVATASPTGNLRETQTVIEIVHAAPIRITSPCPLPVAEKDVPYSYQLEASGGTVLPLNWTILSGTLPAGLSMDANGLISGTPSARGYLQIVVKASNGS